MDYEHVHHVVKTMHKLVHNFLNNSWVNLVASQLHNIFEIAPIAKLHEYVISSISLDGLLELHHVLTLYAVLVLNLTHDQLLFGVT